MNRKHVIFTVEDETFSVPVEHVAEIIRLQKVTRAPELPDYVRGLMNVRGRMIPVVDMRLKFNKNPKEYDDHTAVIVMEILEISFGLIVDDVIEVAETDIAVNEISDPTREPFQDNAKSVKGKKLLN